jgi:N-acetylglucosamine-6-phosphate deacetylase
VAVRTLPGRLRNGIYAGPGLTDLQVNGYNGIDFNTAPLDAADVRRVSDALVQAGVTRFFPTVITNSTDRIISLLESIDRACSEDPALVDHIPGIHLEGPFVSPDDGARGAHSANYVTAPDRALFDRFQKAARGKIRVITLSPEWKGSSSFIKRCVRLGVVVSIGHTNATPEQIQEAIRAGATMSTHLGNGAPLMLPRHPNFIWEQLASDALTACIIADGFHLPPAFIKTVLRAKKNNTILVSDCTMFAGMKPGIYSSHIGGRVRLDTTGRLCMDSDPRMLAGAALALTRGIDHLINEQLATLQQAWSMASLQVNNTMGIPNGTRDPFAGDMVIFERKSNGIHIKTVFKSRRLVYAA